MLILFFIPFLITKLNAQTKFGANIGLLNSYSQIENHFASIDTGIKKIGSKRGIKIDGFAEFKLKENWRIVSTINFVVKGGKYFYDSISSEYASRLVRIDPLTQNIRTSYIEIEPLTVVYKTEKMYVFFAGVGPVSGIGISGKVRLRHTGKLMASDAAPEREIKFNGKRYGPFYSDSTFHLKPIEIGAVMNLGYELKKEALRYCFLFIKAFQIFRLIKKGFTEAGI